MTISRVQSNFVLTVIITVLKQYCWSYLTKKNKHLKTTTVLCNLAFQSNLKFDCGFKWMSQMVSADEVNKSFQFEITDV